MVKEFLKNAFGLLVAIPIAGAAAQAVGGVTAIPRGIRGATQSFIGLGVAGKAAGLFTKQKW